MKVFITGATGFLGSRLIAKLMGRDDVEITALCRAKPKRLPPQVRVVSGDILDSGSLERAADSYDVVFHLAALITFDPARKEELQQVNARGTANVLRASRHWRAGKTVLVSSACTLGISRAPTEIRDEDTAPASRLVRRNPYMASKVEAERLAIAAAREQEVVIVNPTTVYGPGDWSLNSGTLLLQVAKARWLPVPPGGSNVVDVDDVASGMIAAAERGIPGRRYVLGGENLLFSEIMGTICQVTDSTPCKMSIPAFLRGPAAAAAWLAGKVSGNRFLTPQIIGDLFDYKFYSNARAGKELGWQPQTHFTATVKRALAFYRENGLA